MNIFKDIKESIVNKLPDYYITKQQAKDLGGNQFWGIYIMSRRGNL